MITKSELKAMSTKEIRNAIVMGENNFSSVKDEYKQDLRKRIKLLQAEYTRRTSNEVIVLQP